MKIKCPNEPHLPIVFLVDTSGSMCSSCKGVPVEDVNYFFEQLIEVDVFHIDCIDIAIIEFNDTARVVQDFTPLTQLQPVTLSASGCTAMGKGIDLALDRVRERMRFYEDIGTLYYRPIIFMLTDGQSTDDVSMACERLHNEEEKNRVRFWALGIEGCDKKQLVDMTSRALFINHVEVNIKDALMWLFNSAINIKAEVYPEDERNSSYTMPEGIELLTKDELWL